MMTLILFLIESKYKNDAGSLYMVSFIVDLLSSIGMGVALIKLFSGVVS